MSRVGSQHKVVGVVALTHQSVSLRIVMTSSIISGSAISL